MRVKFLNSCVTDGPAYNANTEYELEDEMAAGFIAAGHAVAVDDVEEAILPDQSTEEAVLDGKKNRRR